MSTLCHSNSSMLGHNPHLLIKLYTKVLYTTQLLVTIHKRPGYLHRPVLVFQRAGCWGLKKNSLHRLEVTAGLPALKSCPHYMASRMHNKESPHNFLTFDMRINVVHCAPYMYI
jgi:hypothetical protein